MKALLYKCTCELRYKIFGMLIGVVFSMFFLTGKYCVFLAVTSFFIAGAVSLNTVYKDDKSHWNKYCDILPVSRKSAVSQSYLMAVILNTVMYVLVAVIRVIGLIINDMAVSVLNIAEIIPAYLVGIAIISFIYFLIYRFSYNVGMVIYMALCGTIGGIFGFLTSYFDDEDTMEIGLLLNVTNSGTVKIYLIVSLIAIVIAVISWIMAVRVYSKREL